MFTPDVIQLRQFYTTRLGKGIHRLVSNSLYTLWPHAKGETVLAIGYCAPYLESYLPQASAVMIGMPAQQGAAYWPPGDHNVVFLSHESEIPLAEGSVNRILLMHSVEHTEQLSGLFLEMYRLLTPGGRILAVVPNRMGVWARSPRSPFGSGRPFSMTQLRDLLTQQQFTITNSTSSLFIPPVYNRFLWRLAQRIETLGKTLCPFIGGVLMVEAEKQLYAAIKQPVAAPTRYPAHGHTGQVVLGME